MEETLTELQQKFEILKEEYVKLINDKDVLLNWGKPQLEALYTVRVGRFQIERLQAQLRIKALKRKIEMVQSAINRQVKVDINDIELQVAAELAQAEQKIMIETAKLESAKNLLSNLESPERSAELRKLYYKFAKSLHPDVNDSLTPEQQELWHIIKSAYESGDLEKLKALQIVYEKELKQASQALQQLTPAELELKMVVLKEGIKVLHSQVADIRSAFPFNMEDKIKDDQWVEEEVQKINVEMEALKRYEEELTLQYSELIKLI